MNERYRLNSELIRQKLDEEGRKTSWLSRELNVSGSLVDKMLSQGHVPKERTLDALAALLGVQVDDLLLPRESERAAI